MCGPAQDCPFTPVVPVPQADPGEFAIFVSQRESNIINFTYVSVITMNSVPICCSRQMVTDAHFVDSCHLDMSFRLLKTPLLTGCKARLASDAKVPVLNWPRKGQAGPRQRPRERSAEAENRDGEDLVCVPQVSGEGVGAGVPTSPQHRHLLSQTQPDGRPGQAPQLSQS